ncbi:hypothetical protein OAE07_02535 [Winogradskyella sp.]|nr:hypothetical protein [Winogradskyella sp.]MDC1505042.1 hypothetical protein [Winogradskyella sp.]
MEYLIKASAVITLFYLCFYFFLKKETFFEHNRKFLLIGLLIAIVFPLIVIPIYIPVEPMLQQESFFVIQESANHNAPVVTENRFNWMHLLPIIYGIGLILFFIQFLFQFGSLIILLLKNPKNKNGMYTYVIVNNRISPFSFFKWIVFNPNAYNETELNLMLTHEKVHASQLHSLDIILIQLGCVIFWFNPFMWLYRNDVKQNLEYIADQITQEKSKNNKEYQHLLLKTSVGEHNISLSNNFYNSLIKERIVMLKKSRSNTKKQWRYLLMLPLLAGLLMSMNTKKVYIESDTIIENSSQPTVEFVVTKNTTDKELNAMSAAIENKGGTLVFSQVKRNKKNELVNIFLKLNNHSYGYSNNTAPIDSFIIYKEFFGRGGGYVGRINGATLHFDNNTNDKEIIDALKKRAHQSIINKGIQTTKTPNKADANNIAIKVTFNKEMSDNDLEEIKKELKLNGISMNIKRLKRNRNNDITAINISFKTKNGTTNYNTKDNKGIKPFYFSRDDDGSFGVSSVKDYAPVIVETIRTEPLKKREGNIYFHKDNGEVVEIVEDTFSYKGVQIIKGNKSPSRLYDLDSLPVVTGRYTSSFTNDTIRVVRGTKTDSIKVKYTYKVIGAYEEHKEPIKATITGESYTIYQQGKVQQNAINYFNSDDEKPLIILEGKVLDYDELNTINPKHIKSTTVLKDKTATSVYGEKAKNGVIIIALKEDKKGAWEKKLASKEKGPWKIIRSEVSSVQYIDDEDSSKNGTLAYISRYSTDKVLDSQKTLLEKQGITVKYSKVKRNKAGEITSIKISLNNGKGQETSARFKSDDGITGIQFGLSEGSLIIGTSGRD